MQKRTGLLRELDQSIDKHFQVLYTIAAVLVVAPNRPDVKQALVHTGRIRICHFGLLIECILHSNLPPSINLIAVHTPSRIRKNCLEMSDVVA